MLWLYWFGIIFLEYLDQRKLVAVYLLGGISGAIVYILSFNIFPAFTGIVADSVAIGASASVMAIVIAIAAYVPDYTINLFLIRKGKDQIYGSCNFYSYIGDGFLSEFGRKACSYGRCSLWISLYNKSETGKRYRKKIQQR